MASAVKYMLVVHRILFLKEILCKSQGWTQLWAHLVNTITVIAFPVTPMNTKIGTHTLCTAKRLNSKNFWASSSCERKNIQQIA